MNDTEKVIELLCSCLRSNKVLNANDYVVNPALGQFRSSQIPYCDRKIVFSSLAKVFKYLGFVTNLIDEADKQVAALKEKDPLQFSSSSGTLLHQSFQSLLGETETVSVLIEEPVFLPLGSVSFFGHIDIQLVTSDTIWLIDLKTKKDFDWLDKTGVPDKHNAEQVTVYDKFLQLKFPDYQIKPFILYMLRTEDNDLRIIDLFYPENWRVFPSPYDRKRFDRMVDKADYVRKLCRAGKLPAITDEGWQCSNSSATCVYYNICYDSKPDDLYELGTLFTEFYQEEGDESDG